MTMHAPIGIHALLSDITQGLVGHAIGHLTAHGAIVHVEASTAIVVGGFAACCAKGLEWRSRCRCSGSS
jgi:hypothetical protein